MITREIKSNILKRFSNEDERVLVSNILDKVYRFEKSDKLEYTNFLNLNEFSIISSILNELKIKYEVFSLNDVLNKKMIFLIPEYITIDKEFFSNYISVLKITPNVSNKLTHKDYMGAIYNLGINHDIIGDIFVNEKEGYVFCIKNMSEFIKLNLFNVGKQEVKVKELDINLKEVKELKISTEEKEIITTSLRADAVLASMYNLSRSEVKEKINKGDLYINDKVNYYLDKPLKELDIVSFKRCGKLKIGKVIRKTRSNRYVLVVFKYV